VAVVVLYYIHTGVCWFGVLLGLVSGSLQIWLFLTQGGFGLLFFPFFACLLAATCLWGEGRLGMGTAFYGVWMCFALCIGSFFFSFFFFSAMASFLVVSLMLHIPMGNMGGNLRSRSCGCCWSSAS
jgi:hypothetical protein